MSAHGIDTLYHVDDLRWMWRGPVEDEVRCLVRDPVTGKTQRHSRPVRPKVAAKEKGADEAPSSDSVDW